HIKTNIAGTQALGKKVIPTVNKIAARGPIGGGRRTRRGLRHAPLQIRWAYEHVRITIGIQEQGWPPIRIGARREKSVAVVGVKFQGQLNLLEIVEALTTVGSFLCPGHRGQQHTRQYSD